MKAESCVYQERIVRIEKIVKVPVFSYPLIQVTVVFQAKKRDAFRKKLLSYAYQGKELTVFSAFMTAHQEHCEFQLANYTHSEDEYYNYCYWKASSV